MDNVTNITRRARASQTMHGGESKSELFDQDAIPDFDDEDADDVEVEPDTSNTVVTTPKHVRRQKSVTPAQLRAQQIGEVMGEKTSDSFVFAVSWCARITNWILIGIGYVALTLNSFLRRIHPFAVLLAGMTLGWYMHQSSSADIALGVSPSAAAAIAAVAPVTTTIPATATSAEGK